MYAVDTIEQLIHYGMEPRMARMLVHSGELPSQLTVPNHTSNLELLARHMNLNDPRSSDLIALFLKRDFAVNQRMEIIPKWFGFPENDAAAYLAQPLSWYRDIYDWYNCEQALKLFLSDETLIREILISMFTYGAYVNPEEFCGICRKLAEVNTDQTVMTSLMTDCYYDLFSAYTSTVNCIDRLIRTVGRENVLAMLLSNPLLPRETLQAERIARREAARKAERDDSSDPMQVRIPN